MQTLRLRSSALPRIRRDKHVGLAGQRGTDVKCVHAAKRVRLKRRNRMLNHLGRGVADQRVRQVGHQVGLDLAILRGRELTLTLQATKRRDEFGHGNDREGQFSRALA